MSVAEGQLQQWHRGILNADQTRVCLSQGIMVSADSQLQADDSCFGPDAVPGPVLGFQSTRAWGFSRSMGDGREAEDSLGPGCPLPRAPPPVAWWSPWLPPGGRKGVEPLSSHLVGDLRSLCRD